MAWTQIGWWWWWRWPWWFLLLKLWSLLWLLSSLLSFCNYIWLLSKVTSLLQMYWSSIPTLWLVRSKISSGNSTIQISAPVTAGPTFFCRGLVVIQLHDDLWSLDKMGLSENAKMLQTYVRNKEEHGFKPSFSELETGILDAFCLTYPIAKSVLNNQTNTNNIEEQYESGTPTPTTLTNQHIPRPTATWIYHVMNPPFGTRIPRKRGTAGGHLFGRAHAHLLGTNLARVWPACV